MNSPLTLARSLGLTQPEARVYLASLDLGESGMQELSRKAKVKRTPPYTFNHGTPRPQCPVPPGNRRPAPATLVCLALALAVVALGLRIATIW